MSTYGHPSTQEPNLAELEAAITLHAGQAARQPSNWRHADWTHEQINLLLDQRDHLLNELAAEAIRRRHRRVVDLFRR
jgi:hypothetical protein